MKRALCKARFICTRIRDDNENYGIANLINVERMLAPLSIRCDDAKNAVTGAYRVIDAAVNLYCPGTSIKSIKVQDNNSNC